MFPYVVKVELVQLEKADGAEQRVKEGSGVIVNPWYGVIVTASHIVIQELEVEGIRNFDETTKKKSRESSEFGKSPGRNGGRGEYEVYVLWNGKKHPADVFVAARLTDPDSDIAFLRLRSAKSWLSLQKFLLKNHGSSKSPKRYRWPIESEPGAINSEPVQYYGYPGGQFLPGQGTASWGEPQITISRVAQPCPIQEPRGYSGGAVTITDGTEEKFLGILTRDNGEGTELYATPYSIFEKELDELLDSFKKQHILRCVATLSLTLWPLVASGDTYWVTPPGAVLRIVSPMHHEIISPTTTTEVQLRASGLTGAIHLLAQDSTQPTVYQYLGTMPPPLLGQETKLTHIIDTSQLGLTGRPFRLVALSTDQLQPGTDRTVDPQAIPEAVPMDAVEVRPAGAILCPPQEAVVEGVGLVCTKVFVPNTYVAAVIRPAQEGSYWVQNVGLSVTPFVESPIQVHYGGPDTYQVYVGVSHDPTLFKEGDKFRQRPLRDPEDRPVYWLGPVQVTHR